MPAFTRRKTIIRAGGETRSPEHSFVATARELMARVSMPFVPACAVHGWCGRYLGYDAAAWFEPWTLQDTTEVETKPGHAVDTVARSSTTCGTAS
jgi:hypothetical protein